MEAFDYYQENSERTPLTIKALNGHVKRVIEGDPFLNGIFVTGEISNFRGVNQSGHLYFNLKDEEGNYVSCAMFRGKAMRLTFIPKEGMKVLAYGSCSIYEKSGSFQFIIDSMEEDGIGRLYKEFEKLKIKLQSEGLFDPEHKRNLPFLPKQIGVITSPTGAVIQDILRNALAKFPGMPIKLYPSPVQGEGAAIKIIEALETAINENVCDVLIIARGGGSIEDLWPYNDEKLARAIYNSPIPVISAVGHETDFTIADFVADVRAATPTEAARLAVPDKELLKRNIFEMKSRLSSASELKHDRLSQNLKMLYEMSFLNHTERIFAERYVNIDRAREKLLSIGNLCGTKKTELSIVKESLQKTFKDDLQEKKRNNHLLSEKLQILGPKNVLKRGYSIVTGEDGKILESKDCVPVGTLLNIELRDGKIAARREK